MATVNIILEAAEYNAATNRVTSALQLLRDEMGDGGLENKSTNTTVSSIRSLRHQDLTLMRQLITINDSIKSLGQEQRTQAAKTKTQRCQNQAKRTRNKTRHITKPLTMTTPCSKRQTPLVRQQSLPRYFDVIPEVHERRGSMSSEDDSQDESLSDSLTSLDDETCDTDSVSSAIPVFQTPAFQRQRSRSMLVGVSANAHREDSDDPSYEHILKKNVQLWKECKDQDEDSDSVFENSFEEDAQS